MTNRNTVGEYKVFKKKKKKKSDYLVTELTCTKKNETAGAEFKTTYLVQPKTLFWNNNDD